MIDKSCCMVTWYSIIKDFFSFRTWSHKGIIFQKVHDFPLQMAWSSTKVLYYESPTEAWHKLYTASFLMTDISKLLGSAELYG